MLQAHFHNTQWPLAALKLTAVQLERPKHAAVHDATVWEYLLPAGVQTSEVQTSSLFVQSLINMSSPEEESTAATAPRRRKVVLKAVSTERA
jgi:hypothetical protein